MWFLVREERTLGFFNVEGEKNKPKFQQVEYWSMITHGVTHNFYFLFFGKVWYTSFITFKLSFLSPCYSFLANNIRHESFQVHHVRKKIMANENFIVKIMVSLLDTFHTLRESLQTFMDCNYRLMNVFNLFLYSS